MSEHPQCAEVAGPAGDLVVWTYADDGLPALLLHGVGNYGRYWDLFARAVAGRLRLVAPDARGHGDSVKAGGSPDDFAADALAILDALGIPQVLVVGHSMGGGHAVHLASSHPDRVSRLVVVDLATETMREGSERARRLLFERPAAFPDDAAASAYLRRTSPGYSDEVYANRLAHAFRRTPDGLEWKSDQRALAQIGQIGGSGDAWSEWRSLRVPTLLVRGTRSNVLSADVARRMIDALPGASYLELEAGHNVPLDRPAELADAVIAFGRG